ncbi:hypothetical protein CDL12_23144 [Handroanthus impetiginosus]|uniref:BZIP domain-containing protein n=1 Tax=Handroanthus impetiginosus TaxID=429701 RepID=A0A2G9GGA5_9LAMI|nr:hypothetical protein CDL12_23144 [Handroanthus impetiginosus]
MITSGGSHSRSLSQPTLFANNCLPPLSPFPPSESSLASSNSNLKNAAVEEINVSSQGPAIGLCSPRENPFRSNNGLPPRRGHRRSNSDVPLGFSAVIQSSPQLAPISGQGSLGRIPNTRENSGNDKSIGMKRREMDTVSCGKSCVEDDLVDSFMNLDNAEALNSSGANNKDKDTIFSSTKISGGDSSNSESESISRHGISCGERLKRSNSGDIASQLRHNRSLSMDSGIGKFHFGDSSPKLHTSSYNSLSENLAKINLGFGHGEFNEVELKKIMADERLAEIAVSDPKRAKRILANRQSAARSKERKLHYISELEHKVQTLQTEATTLSAQITILQKDHAELTSQNNELKFRLQAMEQQAQLRDALHETLTAEVQRLKLANMEFRESNDISQQAPTKHPMFSTQRHQLPNQIQSSSVATSKTSTTPSAAPASS